jgi:hypothetical protein
VLAWLGVWLTEWVVAVGEREERLSEGTGEGVRSLLCLIAGDPEPLSLRMKLSLLSRRRGCLTSLSGFRVSVASGGLGFAV